MGNQSSHSDELWFEIQKVIEVLTKDSSKEKVSRTIRVLEQAKERISKRDGHTQSSWAELLKEVEAIVRSVLADPEIMALLV